MPENNTRQRPGFWKTLGEIVNAPSVGQPASSIRGVSAADEKQLRAYVKSAVGGQAALQKRIQELQAQRAQMTSADDIYVTISGNIIRVEKSTDNTDTTREGYLINTVTQELQRYVFSRQPYEGGRDGR